MKTLMIVGVLSVLCCVHAQSSYGRLDNRRIGNERHFEPRLFRESGRHFGHSGRHFGGSGRHLGESGRHFGDTGRHFGESARHFGDVGPHFGDTGRHLGDSRRHFGDSGRLFGESSRLFGIGHELDSQRRFSPGRRSDLDHSSGPWRFRGADGILGRIGDRDYRSRVSDYIPRRSRARGDAY